MAEKFLNLKITSRGKLLNVSGQTIKLSEGIKKRLGDKGLLKKDLKRIAQFIRDDISLNINRGKRFDTGGKVKALAPATIKRKGFSKPLYETGKMVLGVIVEDKGGVVNVRMKKDKYPKKSKGQKKTPTVEQVAKWNNESRPFFGINKKNLTKFTNEALRERLFR